MLPERSCPPSAVPAINSVILLTVIHWPWIPKATCILPRPTGAGGYKSSGSSKVSKSSGRSAFSCHLPADDVATGSPIAFAGLSLNIISSSRSVKPRLFISAANAPTPTAPAYSFGCWFVVQNSDRKQCSGPAPRIKSVRLSSSTCHALTQQGDLLTSEDEAHRHFAL